MIEVDIESRAKDFLARLKKSQPKHHRQILDRIDVLRRFAIPPHRAKVRMKGGEYWRISAGEYRIIYWDQDDGLRIIQRIGKRNDDSVYRDFNRS